MTVNNIHAASNDLISKVVEKEALTASKEPAIEVLWRLSQNNFKERGLEHYQMQLRHYFSFTGKQWPYLCTIDQAIAVLDAKVDEFLINYSKEGNN